MDFGSTAAEFLQHCASVRNLSPHTLRAYRADLGDIQQHLAARGLHELTGIDHAAIRGYFGSLLGQRRLAPATARRRAAVLSSLFHWVASVQPSWTPPLHGMNLQISCPVQLPRNLSSATLRTLLRHFAGRVRLDPALPYREQRLIGCSRPRMFAALTLLVATEILVATGLRVGELAS